MQNTLFLFVLLLSLVLAGFAQEEEERTPPREWTATTGQKLTAVGLAYDGKVVKLLTTRRREVELPAARLVQEDIDYLESFFPPPSPAHTLGQPSSPVEAGRGASYIAYIPSTYSPRGTHALIVHTIYKGADIKSVIRHQKALEDNAWCYIAIIESTSEQTLADNYAIADRCIRHAIKELPVDRKRIYFTGSHMGGNQALYNLSKYHGAGAFVADVFLRPEHRISLSNRDLVITGRADSAFRYSSAEVARRNGARSTKLMYHDEPQPFGAPWLVEDALCWLDARHLRRDYSPDPSKKLAFEAFVLERIEGYREQMPYRSYYWATYMTTEWKLSEANRETYKDVLASLGTAPSTVQFTESLEAVAEFALKVYAPFGKEQLPKYTHNHESIAKAGNPIPRTFPKSEILEDVLPMLGKRTTDNPNPKPAKQD